MDEITPLTGGCFMRVNPCRSFLFHRASIAVCFLGVWLAVCPVFAVVPIINLWSRESRVIRTALDKIETNRLYQSGCSVDISGSVRSSEGGASVEVEDLLVCLSLPMDVSLTGLGDDVQAEGGMYTQWEAAQTALVVRPAMPLLEDTGFWVGVKLVDSNAWSRPLVEMSRACNITRVEAFGVVTQEFVVVLAVAPDALVEYDAITLSLPDWPYSEAPVEIFLAGSAWPSNFTRESWGSLPTYYANEPASLSGSYVFTNVLLLSNRTDRAVDFMPQAELSCVKQAGHYGTSRGTFVRQGDGSGLTVIASVPRSVRWESGWERGCLRMELTTKWVSDGNVPTPQVIRLVRSETLSVNDLAYSLIMVSLEGENLLGAVLNTPGGQAWDMEMEDGEGLYFEPASRHSEDLSEFTNGTYRIDLLNFTNGLLASYECTLTGSPVEQVPVLLTPEPFTNNPRPFISWLSATADNVNAILLILKNGLMDSEDFSLWTGNSQTNHVPESDMFAAAAYTLMFADLVLDDSGDVEYMTGHLFQREGLFNVISNNLIPAAVHLVAEPAATVVDQWVALAVVNYGLFPGSQHSFLLDFGDGHQTNIPSSHHAYSLEGAYTARVVAIDNTSFGATGCVTVSIYSPIVLARMNQWAGSGIELSLPTVSGAVYRTYYTDDLLQEEWLPMASVLSGNGSDMYVRSLNCPRHRAYRLACELPEFGASVGFEALEFPFGNVGDIVRMAAYGIPNWSGSDPHNGIDLQIDDSLISSSIISPVAGRVTGIETHENPYSNPPNQLMVTVSILAPSGLEVYLVLEPSTTDSVTKANQLAAIHVIEGDDVDVGTPIAELLVGNLGYPHLHYMVMRDGDLVCAYGYSSPAAQAIFETLAQIPESNLPDGNICYGQP
jgi:murein DD-endopeptidase MepM/ murein hydrolase activator NlpD